MIVLKENENREWKYSLIKSIEDILGFSNLRKYKTNIPWGEVNMLSSSPASLILLGGDAFHYQGAAIIITALILRKQSTDFSWKATSFFFDV